MYGVSTSWRYVRYSIDESKGRLNEDFSKDELVAMLINTSLNNYMRAATDRFDCLRKDGERRRIPYIGGYWRAVDFVNRDIPIGRASGVTGDFTGIAEHDNLAYEGTVRNLNKEEAGKVVEIVEKAWALYGENYNSTKHEKELDKLWPLLQSFDTPPQEEAGTN